MVIQSLVYQYGLMDVCFILCFIVQCHVISVIAPVVSAVALGKVPSTPALLVRRHFGFGFGFCFSISFLALRHAHLRHPLPSSIVSQPSKELRGACIIPVLMVTKTGPK